ncbi:MAG: transcription antitermination protein NusB [Cyanobacteria bacterium SID2]|nr:transcription antitermination protein NusB [Cyanobacteria bacterium SID2]MBP0004286.1 transcription antitermination protein NusB [Cyanobacteria bacterium SBC]
MQARSIARELALLSLSQLPKNQEKLTEQQLDDIVLAAVRAMTLEAHETLETAAAELKRGSDRLFESETRTTDLKSAKAMVSDAMELTRQAIDRLGMAVELPEFVQLTSQVDVREYALQILTQVTRNRSEIDTLLDRTIVDWQLDRLPRIEQDVLRIAVAEIQYIGTPDRIAIDEAVELTKRYSGDNAYRFVNGVLRRIVDVLNSEEVTPSSPQSNV